MKAIQPRELRLTIDVVRDELKRSPFVLKVKSRTAENTELVIHRVDKFDVEFSQNFFFYFPITTQTTPMAPDGQVIRIMMCPLALVGDE